MRKTSVWALATMAALAAVLGVACGDDTSADGSGDICADVSCDASPKFADLNWSLCTSCHSSDATVRQDEGVPSDSDYTTYTGVSSRLHEIAVRVNDTETPMPPNGKTALNDGEKEAFTTWGCCDGPQ